MKLVFLASALMLSPAVYAEDLESVFSQTSQTQTARNSSYLADVMRGILRTPTSEQAFFLRLLEDSKWNEALFQFEPAFQNTEFIKSEDAQALKALLLFRAGVTVHAVENLFQIKEPKKIHFQIMNQWREAAQSAHPVWMVARLQWKKDWTEIFGVSTEVRVRSADLTLASNVETLNELSMVALPDSRERALMDWNLAIQYGSKDEVKKAAVIVSALMKAKNNPVPEDLLTVTAARLLYQSAYFEAAEKYYDKIPKSSDYYFQAQEEKAWSFLRRRQPQNALAITQTLVNPVLSGQIEPETWFVRALAQLKTCDYPAALETLRAFPTEFKVRTVALDKLTKEAKTEEVLKALDLIGKNTLNLPALVKISKNLPQGMVRDEILRQLVKTQQIFEGESKAVETLTAAMRDIAARAEFETLKNSATMRAAQALSNTIDRVKKLAQVEVDETKAILNKLHIVEAEIIQQVETASKVAKSAPAQEDIKIGTTGSVAEDVLKFPFQKEFWFDELTNYKVDLKKACQAKRAQ
jgi:tetratricopeptide (TPR) repeat protein